MEDSSSGAGQISKVTGDSGFGAGQACEVIGDSSFAAGQVCEVTGHSTGAGAGQACEMMKEPSSEDGKDRQIVRNLSSSTGSEQACEVAVAAPASSGLVCKTAKHEESEEGEMARGTRLGAVQIIETAQGSTSGEICQVRESLRRRPLHCRLKNFCLKQSFFDNFFWSFYCYGPYLSSFCSFV
jgi:hypothetical protein